MDDHPSWIEVSLTVAGELAEAVAEVLARFTPGGVVIESTHIGPHPLGEGHPIGPLRVVAYLPADAGLASNRRRLEEALWHLGRIQPLPEPEFRPIQPIDWTQSWKQHYHPLEIGRQLVVVPAWYEPPSAGRIPIIIEPGMAFGTGTHPTTRLCLELLEDWLPKGQAVIDVGCGSGVLAIAALKLGANAALGVDNDSDAIDNARANAALNGVAGALGLGTGSLTEILAGEFSLRQAALVMANILAPVIIRLLDQGLAELVSPRGTLILSGILAEQEAAVQAAWERHGLLLRERRQVDDWVALVLSAAGRMGAAGPR